MQLLVPGETAVRVSATARAGTPSAADSGEAFTVTVNGVDANWNVFSTKRHGEADRDEPMPSCLPTPPWSAAPELLRSRTGTAEGGR